MDQEHNCNSSRSRWIPYNNNYNNITTITTTNNNNYHYHTH